MAVWGVWGITGQAGLSLRTGGAAPPVRLLCMVGWEDREEQRHLQEDDDGKEPLGGDVGSPGVGQVLREGGLHAAGHRDEVLLDDVEELEEAAEPKARLHRVLGRELPAVAQEPAHGAGAVGGRRVDVEGQQHAPDLVRREAAAAVLVEPLELLGRPLQDGRVGLGDPLLLRGGGPPERAVAGERVVRTLRRPLPVAVPGPLRGVLLGVGQQARGQARVHGRRGLPLRSVEVPGVVPVGHEAVGHVREPEAVQEAHRPIRAGPRHADEPAHVRLRGLQVAEVGAAPRLGEQKELRDGELPDAQDA
mmetsp:Transcript_137655/g.427646  ORF Transcript_137655/g.427646 Transcript_137655/m.427646 type:complete len:305 (-) Transcript_137655:313-1227(-)